MARRGWLNVSSGIGPSSPHSKIGSMRIATLPAILLFCGAAWCADTKVDRRKVQAALQQAARAEAAGQTEQAIAAYSDVLQLDPVNGAAFTARAVLYRKAGQLDKA